MQQGTGNRLKQKSTRLGKQKWEECIKNLFVNYVPTNILITTTTDYASPRNISADRVKKSVFNRNIASRTQVRMHARTHARTCA